MGLSEEEITIKREITTQMHKVSKLNCIIQWQKFIARWLKEGDANSKYFHGCINKRSRGNEILSLEVDGRQLIEAEDTRNAIAKHFHGHLSAKGVKLVPANMNFKSLEE